MARSPSDDGAGPYQRVGPEKTVLVGEKQSYVVTRLPHEGLCDVYHGYAQDGTEVFAKTFERSRKGHKLYQTEQDLIPRAAEAGITPRLLDVGKETRLIVQPYINGKSLEAVLKSEGRLKPAQARAYILPILTSGTRMHQIGIIHRDIKPGNIIIPKNGTPMLVDFGVARDKNAADALCHRAGTRHYNAPEQHTNTASDERSDIYSAGITLYETFTGANPFPESFSEEGMRTIKQEPFILDRISCPDERLRDVVRKATAPSPTDRYQSFPEMVDAMEKRTMWTTLRDRMVEKVNKLKARVDGAL